MRVLAKLLAVLALGVIMCIPAVTNASAVVNAPVVLSDNLSTSVYAYESVTTTRWVTASFGTDGMSYDLNSVTLQMYLAIEGVAEADIYTDKSLQPGSLVGVLTSPDSYPTSDANVTFTASGITLNPNSTYWLVLKAISGEFDWAWTMDDAGSGVGFQHTFGHSSDSGKTWDTYDINTGVYDISPLKMRVEGTPVPVPPGLLLLGLVRLAALRRWRRG